jgi:hypothetical protein
MALSLSKCHSQQNIQELEWSQIQVIKVIVHVIVDGARWSREKGKAGQE